MILPFFNKFLRSRRAATAVALAIMFVPMVVAASAAVDFARAASARALMQAAVDGAVEEGSGAYQTSENSTDAYNVTQATYLGTSSQLGKFVSNINPQIGVYCSLQGTATQCGGGASSGTLSGYCPTAFNTTKEYCIVVTLSSTLKNSLFAWIIPSELLSVKSVGTVSFPPNNISGKNIPPSPGFGSAGDKSSVYAYGVPMDNPDGSADYGELPVPTGGCSSATGQLPLLVGTSNSTACNYLFVADSLGDGGNGGSISLQNNQPIAFAFVNYTGANGYTQINSAQYTTHIVVSTSSNGSGSTYYQNGKSFTINSNSNTTALVTYNIQTTNYICSNWNSSNGSCYNGYSTTTTNTTTTSTHKRHHHRHGHHMQYHEGTWRVRESDNGYNNRDGRPIIWPMSGSHALWLA